VQGRSHLAVLGRVLPGVALTLFDRHPERAEALAALARETDGIDEISVAPDARLAVHEADVVVTAASFGPLRQVMTADWLADDALVVPVDYATYLAAEVAHAASLFLVDDRGQFLSNREAGLFDGYPDPTATLGEAILAGTQRPADGRVVVTHLGVGLADVTFGAAILRRAETLGLGIVLGDATA
jgi:ornithine cyclodeaminase/alanine dehydrogenase